MSLIELPANVTDSSQPIASGCSNTKGSSFVATGRGGIPQNLSEDVRSYAIITLESNSRDRTSLHFCKSAM
ncbi:hypothetical protein NIES2109_27480 [Nostoc sp. HK-01]|nr:hypothetical protein NIES2109_27480 [Nostoc sp. HK-01]